MPVEVQEIKSGESVFFTLGKEPNNKAAVLYKGSYLKLDLLGRIKEPAHQVQIIAKSDPKGGFQIGQTVYLSAKEMVDEGIVHPRVKLYTLEHEIK